MSNDGVRGLPAVPDTDQIVLAAGEWLGDRPPVLRGQCIVLEGETGIGKSRYVLDVLARDGPVLLLVPSVSQVEQLARNSPGRTLSFVHGNRRPERLHPTIVATYDQLGALRARLGAACTGYTLVVDELHKLYQAGSYRPKALQGLLDAIDALGQAAGFARLLGLSATLQPALLDFAIDQWISVRKPAATVVRQVSIVEYDRLKVWEETLLRQDLLPRDVLNVIRLNDVQRLHALEAFFGGQGYRCLVVHSRIQDEDDVQQMLADQYVTDCNLLLCTSLIDEGVNIENERLGCVHLIGEVHSAELRQFLGRFRHANPELFLHVAKLPEQGPLLDIADERDFMRQLQYRQHADYHALLTRTEARDGPFKVAQITTLVREFNATHRRLCGFDLLIARVCADGDVEILPNRPGLLGYLFGLDTRNHYGSLATLTARLQEQFGACVVCTYTVGGQEASPGLEADLRATAALVETQRQRLIDALERRLYGAGNPDLLAVLADLVRACGRENTREASLIRTLRGLATQVAADVETALAMLRASHEHRAWQFVKALDDALVVALHRLLAEVRTARAPGPGQPVGIAREEGRRLVLLALAQVSRADPLYRVSAHLLGARHPRGILRGADGQYDVTPQFVTKLFRDFTDSEIGRHAYRYRGPAWGGYRYARLVGSATPPRRRNTATDSGRGSLRN